MNLQQTNSTRITLPDQQYHPVDESIAATNTIENLRRLVPSDYADGISTPAGEDRPSARAISNAMATQDESILNTANASDYLWQWGQFIDHDLDLTDGVEPA